MSFKEEKFCDECGKKLGKSIWYNGTFTKHFCCVTCAEAGNSEHVLTVDTEVGVKDDKEKNRLDLIPVEVIEKLGEVLTYGAKKYSPSNWNLVDENRYEAALLRHYVARGKGGLIDPESNLLHSAHMMANILFLIMKDLKK